MRAALAVATIATVVLSGGVADAAPRKVLVLRADGKIDAAAKTKIDAAVLALARKLDGEISPGEITFSDATAAVGCTGDVTACGTQVIDTLAVDEVIAVTVEAAPGGEVLVSVQRVSRVSQREAHGKVSAAKPEPGLTDSIGTLFGLAAKPAPATTTTTTPTTTAPTTTTTPAPTTTTPTTAITTNPTPIEPYPTSTTTPSPVPPPASVTQPEPEPTVTAAPDNVVTGSEGRGRTSRLAIGGLAGGGALMLIGVVLWNSASSTQSEIDKAPTRTHDDLIHLQELESSADSYALWGNVTFFTGVAVAGAGGFLLWRSRRSHQTARLTPIVVDHGGGVAVTIGGRP